MYLAHRKAPPPRTLQQACAQIQGEGCLFRELSRHAGAEVLAACRYSRAAARGLPDEAAPQVRFRAKREQLKTW